MTEPQLTIAIPTLDRPEHLQHAIDSALRQTVPVRIIIADQGHSDETRKVIERYGEHPNVKHIRTAATNLWENWRAAAEAADTPLIAWLQDDDVLMRAYAYRVCKAFEAYPQALHWQGRCYCSIDRQRAAWWGANGPCVPLDMVDMRPEMWPGGILIASMFITSWALSPGVAFRNGPEFRLALEGMPAHADLFAERLILAAMGAQGNFIADPIVAGLWHHHGENTSYKQNADGSMPSQRALMCQGIDSIIDGFPEWRHHFYMWLRMRSPIEIVNWSNGWDARESRYSDECLKVMAEAIKDRVEIVAAPPGQDDGTVIYDEDEPVAA